MPYLERSLERFHGKIYKSEDGCTAIRTEEGQVAFIEAIEFLRSQKPVTPLKWSDELERAAKDHCQDLGTTGAMSSIGSGKCTLSLSLFPTHSFHPLCRLRWFTASGPHFSILHDQRDVGRVELLRQCHSGGGA